MLVCLSADIRTEGVEQQAALYLRIVDPAGLKSTERDTPHALKGRRLLTLLRSRRFETGGVASTHGTGVVGEEYPMRAHPS